MVDQLMPFVANFKKFIQRLFYPSIDRIGEIETPILFVQGMVDEIVPIDHTERLHRAATKAKFKHLYQCPTGDHNFTWKHGGDEYILAFKRFFDACESE